MKKLIKFIFLLFISYACSFFQITNLLKHNRFIVFMSITLPLALPGIVAGFTLCFARALGEFGATVTFVSNIPGETQTLSTAIYNFLQVPNGELMAMRLTFISIFISISALILSEIIFDKILKYKRDV